jgi:hypothetical protein
MAQVNILQYSHDALLSGCWSGTKAEDDCSHTVVRLICVRASYMYYTPDQQAASLHVKAELLTVAGAT